MESMLKKLFIFLVIPMLFSFSTRGASCSTIYSLMPDSLYEEGCVPPCMCPIWISEDVSGRFLMEREYGDQYVSIFRLNKIKWKVNLNNSTYYEITGRGVYRIYGETGDRHQLVLDLSFNKGDVEHFDSGIVRRDMSSSSISVIVKRGTGCYDKWITISAQPGMLYALREKSTFSEGCIPPCMCPIRQGILSGTFRLQLMKATSLYKIFYVRNISWVVSSQNDELVHEVTGYGVYRMRRDENGWMQKMDLMLRIDGTDTIHVESKFLPLRANPPIIDIKLDQGNSCYDRWLYITSEPLL